MKYFLHLLSFSTVCILLAGQYGYFPIADLWYDTYAVFSCIITVIMSILGAAIISALQDPEILTDLGSKEKQSIINHSYSLLAYVNSALGWVVLINADFILVAILSIVATILWLETLRYLKTTILKYL